jgi:hypothetical protein
VFTSPVIADFNNNGDNEVALIADESLLSDKYCLFWAWYHDGQIIPDWPKNFGAANVRYATPAIADFDNDKILEIVAGSSAGFIYVWNLPESKGNGNISWPMFQHDSRHSGLYSQPPLSNQPPDIPSAPSPDVGEERVLIPATLTWGGGDPDGKKDAVDYFIDLNEGECGSQVEPSTLIGTVENVPGDKIKIHYKTSQLNPCACYYWKVVARDSKGAEANGPVWCFRVKKDGCVDCPSASLCQ